MNRRERNLLIFLVIVVVVSIPFLPIWGGDRADGGELGADAADGTQAEAGAMEGLSFPRLNRELLALLPEKFEGARRNLFTFSAATDNYTEAADLDGQSRYNESELVGNDAPEPGDASAADLTRPAVQRLTDYEYLGYVEREGERYAAFTWRGSYFVGRAGETVNKTFEIKKIRKKYVDIYVIGGNFEQKLRLREPAGDANDKGDS